MLTETTTKTKAKRMITQTMATGDGKRYHIPKRKVRRFEYNLPMRFLIVGTIPSKKNCQLADANKSRINSILQRFKGRELTQEIIDEVLSVRPFIRNSERYKKWEERWRADLVLQAAEWKVTYEKHGLTFPLTKATISIYHFWKDNQERDNSNKAESIHDTLVACGILSSDAHQCLYRFETAADVYKDDILRHLTTFTITAHEW